MREVCLLISKEGAILWSDASTTPWALPDSRARWEAIWGHRAQLAEIAHSHPGGPLDFSEVDRETMVGIDAALGRRLRYSVVAPEGVVVRTEAGLQGVLEPEREAWWVPLLRLASGMGAGAGAVRPAGN